MNIRFWGTRGSIPSPGPSTLRYGGNTSCAEIRLADGSLIILDAGSGIRALGAVLGSCQATLILSHYHWDHIQGMPFFGPAYSPQSAIRVLGPAHGDAGPKELLTGQMLAPYFPAPASEWKGINGFGIVKPDEPFMVDGAAIRAARLCHPGFTFGYRIEEAGRVLVYISDNEPDLAAPEVLRGIVELASGADLLIHDCQYTESEYEIRCGFGHSTPRQAARIASAAGVRRLALFHHDPGHTDEQLEILSDQLTQLANGFEVFIAREGETLEVGMSVSKAEPPVTSRQQTRSRRAG